MSGEWWTTESGVLTNPQKRAKIKNSFEERFLGDQLIISLSIRLGKFSSCRFKLFRFSLKRSLEAHILHITKPARINWDVDWEIRVSSYTNTRMLCVPCSFAIWRTSNPSVWANNWSYFTMIDISPRFVQLVCSLMSSWQTKGCATHTHTHTHTHRLECAI